MTNAATDPAEAEDGGKSGGIVKPLVFGVVLAALGAGGGYFAAVSGIVGGSGDSGASASDDGGAPVTTFVDIDPMIVSILRPTGVSQLRLRISLEVKEGAAGDVRALMPRILDALNSYLRAVDAVDLGSGATLVRLRAQMLRRVQIVAGDEAVKDLLIQEFVVN